MKKLIPFAIAAVLIPSGLYLYNKYTVYQNATLEYSRQLGKYKVQKILYDDLVSVCAKANADMNSVQDSMNNLVSNTMINGVQSGDLAQQGEYHRVFNQAYSFARDNCIGIEFSAPVPPTPPKF
jgi:hypothetical protein